MLFGSSASQSTLSVSAKMKSASSGLDVIAEEDNDDENGAQVVPSIMAGGGGNAEVEDESEVMSQVFISVFYSQLRGHQDQSTQGCQP